MNKITFCRVSENRYLWIALFLLFLGALLLKAPLCMIAIIILLHNILFIWLISCRLKGHVHSNLGNHFHWFGIVVNIVCIIAVAMYFFR